MASTTLSLRKYVAVIAILIVLVMTVLDVTLVNVALPVLARDFGVSDSASVWIVTVYQLAITMLLLPLSSAGDLYSYRRNFLVGVVVFTLASAMCAASRTLPLLLCGRALQGVGAACVMSVNIALTRLIYPREILARGLALNAMVIAVATAAGPTIAGAILSVASWHWLFIINLPLGVAAFLLGRRLLPSNPPRQQGSRAYDWTSGAANAVAFGLIFYALGSMARRGDLPTAVALLAAGLAVGVFYVRRQLHRSDPMLPVDLLRIRLYALSVATSVCSFVAQTVAMIALPFLFLGAMGYSEIATGLLMTPWPLATMVVAPLAARFVERHNPGLVAAAGMGVYALGLGAFLFFPLSSSGAIVWRMALCGVGFGMFQTPNNLVMVMVTPLGRTAAASGMQSTARLTGQTLGAALATLLLAVIPSVRQASLACLWAALLLAAVAGSLSLCRSRGLRQR